MEKATITEIKNRFSTFLDKVKHGDSVLITERGRPVARLESILATHSNDVEGRLMRLERNGLVRRAKCKPDSNSILNVKQLPVLKENSSLLQAVLAEREENR
jgi:prevent-host-death family protein